LQAFDWNSLIWGLVFDPVFFEILGFGELAIVHLQSQLAITEEDFPQRRRLFL
jgi:hypothetical protein